MFWTGFGTALALIAAVSLLRWLREARSWSTPEGAARHQPMAGKRSDVRCTQSAGRDARIHGPGSLRVEEVRTADALRALAPEWSCLWERCPAATPFQTPEWLLPWWRHLGRGRLRTLALRCDERLVGLVPLLVHRYYGTPLRRIALLGTGITDYLDVLLEPAFETPGMELIFQTLAASGSDWDFCDFQQLRPGSPLLRAAAPSLFASRTFQQEVCPVLPLPLAPAALAEVLPTRLRAHLRYYRRRLLRDPEGADREARFETATEGTLAEVLDALIRLHQSRWNQRRLPGAFAGRRVREFHREAAPVLLDRGWLRLHSLRVDGALGAVLYCLSCRGRGHYYLGGFDPKLAAVSPGTLLTAFAVEDTLGRGGREFDFLRGNEPYKYAWGAEDRPNYRRLVWWPRFPACLAPRLNLWERRAEEGVKALARRVG